MLQEMAQSMGQPPTLTEVRLLAMSLLAFAGFMQGSNCKMPTMYTLYSKT